MQLIENFPNQTWIKEHVNLNFIQLENFLQMENASGKLV